jgi:hypothetical protein
MCYYNKLTSLNGIENLVHLTECHYYHNLINHIPPNLLRRLNRIQNGQNIYGDSQNVHNHNIQESIRKSINNILQFSPIIKNLNEYILADTVLTYESKEILIEYIANKEILCSLNLTFEELAIYVFSRIEINEHKDEIKRVLNIEMNDSICKCLTGRIGRLINCLNGFDELVDIKIADNEQIAQIINLVKAKLESENKYTVQEHKQLVINELSELKYDTETINQWIQYIE